MDTKISLHHRAPHANVSDLSVPGLGKRGVGYRCWQLFALRMCVQIVVWGLGGIGRNLLLYFLKRNLASLGIGNGDSPRQPLGVPAPGTGGAGIRCPLSSQCTDSRSPFLTICRRFHVECDQPGSDGAPG